jgi:two-component system NtrC family sensor kinase
MRMLLVDDDALLLRALSRMLRHHAVATARGGADALNIIRTGRVFDAIVCDLHMPEMTGREFYETLLTLLPELAARVVFMAGGFNQGDDAAFLLAHATILKPFGAAELESVLQRYQVARPTMTIGT